MRTTSPWICGGAGDVAARLEDARQSVEGGADGVPLAGRQPGRVGVAGAAADVVGQDARVEPGVRRAVDVEVDDDRPPAQVDRLGKLEDRLAALRGRERRRSTGRSAASARRTRSGWRRAPGSTSPNAARRSRAASSPGRSKEICGAGPSLQDVPPTASTGGGGATKGSTDGGCGVDGAGRRPADPGGGSNRGGCRRHRRRAAGALRRRLARPRRAPSASLAGARRRGGSSRDSTRDSIAGRSAACGGGGAATSPTTSVRCESEATRRCPA